MTKEELLEALEEIERHARGLYLDSSMTSGATSSDVIRNIRMVAHNAITKARAEA